MTTRSSSPDTPVADANSEAIELVELTRSERAMLIARTVAIPWALFQAVTYSDRPYPRGVERSVFLLIAFLVAGHLAVLVAHRSVSDLPRRRGLAVASLALDVTVVSGIVWLYAFDPGSALWAVLFILPLEGALRFQLRGAITAWVGSAVLYTAREIWAAGRYGFDIQVNSITFRMGIGFVIAMVAGLMARDLIQERRRLAHAVEELRATDRLRSALVSTLAHDVRNPLTSIRGTIRTLLQRGSSVPEEAASSLLAAADRQAERLTRLATDLLDLARLETGRMELAREPVPLRHAVDDALGYVDASGRIANEVDPSLVVVGDKQRLEQVFVNLASNALRYGEAPFVVTGAERNGHVQLSFVDHGTGVPDEDKGSLFEAFRAQETGGSVGFGLAIVKALVEAQGGAVRYEDNAPRGARFLVELPSAE